MANCKDCLHYEPCYEYGNILDPIHGGVKCDSFKPTTDVISKEFLTLKEDEAYERGFAEAKSEAKRCKDCVYFQPNFVLTNNGERRPYTEEEKNSPLGMVTGDVGINCGSRCERFDYWEDNRFPVWFQENDYCSYFKKKYTEETKDEMQST